ncbi:helix-turn-helix transcriptional regulator [Motilimonas pumila]|uniref:AraC family transcriptional regulator n=1 Tax=Motilimonas pumila TaxID=2303987 RepID=A0A418YKX6_9GAMM|nr:helix-turn-helix transcriptional regulator [Motilimonas pumila]RJG51470.1 AraC family transcriptional regulator [Motilimonas pumila]
MNRSATPYPNWLEQVLAQVEAQMPYGCSIEVLANRVGKSKAHLQREFKQHCGLNLGLYMRYRRLSEAALTIAQTDKRLFDVALDYGFESQEAFTRAFRRLYGINPKHLKGKPARAKHIQIPAISSDFLHLYPQLARLTGQPHRFERCHLLGIKRQFYSIRADSKQFLGLVHQMWHDFDHTIAPYHLPESELYTFEYVDACSLHNGLFTMMALIQVEQPAVIDKIVCDNSEALISLTQPARDMLAFHLPQGMAINVFLQYLYMVYLPSHNLHVAQYPIIWHSHKSGRISCYISASQWQQYDLPDALKNEVFTPLSLKTLPIVATSQTFSVASYSLRQRLMTALQQWRNLLKDIHSPCDINKTGCFIALGDLQAASLQEAHFTPAHESQYHFIKVVPSSRHELMSSYYLALHLCGDINEISDAVEIVKYTVIPELNYELTPGVELITRVEKQANGKWLLDYYLPVKKR